MVSGRRTAIESRSLRADALALVVCALSLFGLASLISHDPADPPSTRVHPANTMVGNWGGPAGAQLSAALVRTLGIGSLLACLAGLDLGWTVLCRRSIADILWKGTGHGLLLAAADALMHVVPAKAGIHEVAGTTWLASVSGPGGDLGAVLVHRLREWLSSGGMVFGLSVLVCVGILLAFEKSLARIRRAVSHRPVLVGEVLPPLPGPWRAPVARPPMLLPAPSSLPAEDPGAIVPIHRRLEPRDPADPTDRADWTDPSQSEEPDELVREHPEQELRIVRRGFEGPGPEDLPVPNPPASLPGDSPFTLPGLDLLDDPQEQDLAGHDEHVREKAHLLERTFAQFQMAVKVVRIDTGPVVTQYEIELEPGLRARRVVSLADDLAIALSSPSVRIVAPIPGKNTVGIEVPNERRVKVTLKEVMGKAAGALERMRLPLCLGKDVKGQPLVYDLANMPHLLIAGRTGTGKSVCLNALILSILTTRTPEQVKLLMIDPKMVELSPYKDVPHLLHPVVIDMKKAEALLGWAVEEMEERYDILARCGVRHIDSYNQLSPPERSRRLAGYDGNRLPSSMPYILIFADEMADLMMTAAKEVEAHIIRLAQKSRAVGIHLVLATQKPTVDVITGLIKSNLPARIAFQVASRCDSRVVLDEMGADKLLGNGDMLFLYPGTSKILRAQGTYVSDEEVHRIVEHLVRQGPPQYSRELVDLEPSGSGPVGLPQRLSDRDELYEQAIDLVVREQRGSVSLLQRALGIGYGRGARLIDFMAEDGIVGHYNGSHAREVLYTPEQWDEVKHTRWGKASRAPQLSVATIPP